jgi:integrase
MIGIVENELNKTHDEIMSWWDSRPRHDRRGSMHPITRKYGIAHGYRFYLGGKIQFKNFSYNMPLEVVRAAVAVIEGKIKEEEIARTMGFPTDGGATIKPVTLIELLTWHIREIMQVDKPRTIRNHESTFSDFITWLGDANMIAGDIGLKKLYEYHSYLRQERKNSALTAQNKIKIIKAVFSHAKRKQQIATDPFYDYRGEKITPSEERDILTAAEMRIIADMIWADKKTHWQKIYLAWQICRYTGIRGGDLLRLRFENINYENKTMSFRVAKLNDELITIPIHHSLFDILKKLREKHGPMFSFADFKWSEQILTKRFSHYIRKLKGNNFVKPGSHTPRHSLNQIMLDSGIQYEYRCYLIGQTVAGIQARYLHKKEKSHIEKLRSTIESLPLD